MQKAAARSVPAAQLAECANRSLEAPSTELEPVHPKRVRLFRDQAYRAHARRLEGEVLLIQPPSTKVVCGVLGACALATLVFLATATYPRTERVGGYLVPHGGVSTILPPRAGIVSEVLVGAGDDVRAGDVIVRVASRSALQDGTPPEAGLEVSLRQQRMELEQKLRLVETTSAVGEEKRRIDLRELEERRTHLQRLESLARARLALAQRREAALAELLEKGIVSDRDHQEQLDRVLALESDLRRAQYARLEQDETKRALESQLQLGPTEREAQQADLKIQILGIESQLRELEGRNAYALVSPVAGRVASLQAAPGGDVSPDVPVAIIIPEGSTLEAHLLVPTRAAGLIEVGQRVGIKYAAFPSTTFGVKSAHILRIDTAVLAPREVRGPVTVEEPVYRVVARLDEQGVDAFGHRYPLQPGMQLDAAITLETRSLIAWILEPLYGLSRAGAAASES
jgi:membrane fusion protein